MKHRLQNNNNYVRLFD